MTASTSNGLPRVWASITARVRSPTASASFEGSTLYEGSSTSTKTGTAPAWMIGLTVVGKPVATVITSSPGRMRRSPSFGLVREEKATRSRC